MDNASTLEVGWCLSALAGVVFAFWNLTDAIADWIFLAKSLRDATTGLRKWAARRQLRHTTGMLVISVLILVVGVGALFLPPAPTRLATPRSGEDLLGVIIVLGLIGTTIIISLMSVADFVERRTFSLLLAPVESVEAHPAEGPIA